MDNEGFTTGKHSGSVMSGLGWHHLTRTDKEQILSGLETGGVLGGPYHVELHPTNRCNVNCFFCATRSIRRPDELSMETLERLIGEMKQLGTRSVGLNGGGEPLFHRQARRLLERLREAKLPIANLTTNGVLLTPPIQRLLVSGFCDQLVISLNAANEAEYARIMGMPRRVYGVVLDNVRSLLAARGRWSLKPRIMLHFPVWKENYRTLPGMYARAAELGVDRIIFSGLSFLQPDQRMTPEETAEMMDLYEEILREDEYRRIDTIFSMEQDLAPEVARVSARIGVERDRLPRWKRLTRLALRPDFTLRQKWRHYRRARRRAAALERLGTHADACLIPWYAMVVKGNGAVPVCCVIQGNELGSIHESPLAAIWNGPAFQETRHQTRRIVAEGPDWQFNGQTDTRISPVCGVNKGRGCFMRTFYYWTDEAFVSRLDHTIARIRTPGQESSAA
jgi:MoaA/NifB/PqqE/SkfB family radical SAM enzyme